MRKLHPERHGTIRNATLPVAARLGRLHRLPNRSRDLSTAGSFLQGVVRLLGVQDGRLFAVAGQQNAQIAVRLAV